MNTNIRVENNKIIFDGHASTNEQCNVITNICNALSSNDNFKTIKYEDGYAEFEVLNQASDLKFVAAEGELTVIFDDGVEDVTIVGDRGSDKITRSNTTITTNCTDGAWYDFPITTKRLYKIISVTANLWADGGEVQPYIDGSNKIVATGGPAGLSGTITITTRKDKKIVQPKVKNADGTYDTLIFEEANHSYNSDNATNAVVLANGSFGKIEINGNGVLKIGDHIIERKQKLVNYSTSERTSVTLNSELKVGDIVEIEFGFSQEFFSANTQRGVVRFVYDAANHTHRHVYDCFLNSPNMEFKVIQAHLQATSLDMRLIINSFNNNTHVFSDTEYYDISSDTFAFYIYNVYKILK